MAGLASDGTNPDVSLLYDINGLAKAAPGWFDRAMGFTGEYGIMAGLGLLLLWCWWGVRRRGTPEESASATAGIVWAPLAAVIALLVNVPIRGFVERPRPFREHRGLEVLVAGKTDFSFVSDHSTMAMALAVGLFIVHRRFGLAALALALAEGFCRVYMGVHYPTDVVGGFALGTAVALLLAPAALALLTPLTSAVARSPARGRLVRSRKAPRGGARHETVALADPRREVGGGERGLAA
ncbi:phosphatase PAP2 family protein [Streptomyces sudanensis]|uniref:phosphatase PAP2 family protein n=1 Tax=Streptomyces sudanensis TaxID=436397 RepID=UPI0020CBDD78|nr:phosphatase PAP2 family protein [Streptomyces sudanensis]MCP9987485.1 phosphatase PAP2 family protein [Streptomyces sudanensis]